MGLEEVPPQALLAGSTAFDRSLSRHRPALLGYVVRNWCVIAQELSTGPPVRGVDRRALVEFAGRIEADEPAVGAGLELIAGRRVSDRHRDRKSVVMERVWTDVLNAGCAVSYEKQRTK